MLALEAKDKYTAGHTNRVTNVSTRLAEALGLDEDDFSTLNRGARLHDIGKTGVTDQVLNKVGKLTDEEWNMIRSHPTIGNSILKPISGLEGARDIVRHHHEREDSRGYPDGLGTHGLNRTTKIVILADAYDAMASNRAYRNALSREDIMREIEKGKGTQFSNAHCQAPLCNPSRASVMTGILPSTSGIYSGGSWRASPALASAVTIPEHFSAHGYNSVGVGKIFHSGQNDPSAWDEYGPPGSYGPINPPGFPLNGIDGAVWLDWGPVSSTDEEMPDGQVATWGINKINETHTKPLFLAMGFHRPHTPLYAPQSYFDMYPLGSIILPTVNESDLDDVPERGVQFAMAGSPWPEGDYAKIKSEGKQKEAVQAYLACVSFVDAQIGRVLDAWNASALSDNGTVVLWSDHGWHLGEKLHWRKNTLWEEATQSVLIIKSSEVTSPGDECAKAVGLIDIYPTLIELCGLNPKSELEGESIVPLLTDSLTTWNSAALTTRGFKNHSVRGEQWRYTQYYDGDEELYDHDTDELEWTNLAENPSYDSIKEQMAAFMPTYPREPGAPFDGNGHTIVNGYAEDMGTPWTTFTWDPDTIWNGGAPTGVPLPGSDTVVDPTDSSNHVIELHGGGSHRIVGACTTLTGVNPSGEPYDNVGKFQFRVLIPERNSTDFAIFMTDFDDNGMGKYSDELHSAFHADLVTGWNTITLDPSESGKAFATGNGGEVLLMFVFRLGGTNHVIYVDDLEFLGGADFTASPTVGSAPLDVEFTDESSGGPTNWEWDFDNNGTVDSTDPNPRYTYAQAGIYSVKLTITTSDGNDEELKTGYVAVSLGDYHQVPGSRMLTMMVFSVGLAFWLVVRSRRKA
ncbi:sulfatase-like hydrolase/transferase [Candidatus Hydrogenedentota bacterium]